jgi:polar amino acid transport system substrate-binding protein
MIKATSLRSVVPSIIVLALDTLAATAGSEKDLLTPSGSLRVGVYQGSPTSMVTDPRQVDPRVDP